MTAAQFRKIALSLPEAEEREHMGHPDFRVGGKIFATLGAPDKEWAMVKLTPEQQRIYMQLDRSAFSLAQGAWGQRGATLIRLADADMATLREALTDAWRGTAPKTLIARSKTRGD
jgi:hypothetical protein